jgi:hypothetical protein
VLPIPVAIAYSSNDYEPVRSGETSVRKVSSRLTAVIALTLLTVGAGGVATPASACACGALITNGDTSVGRERAAIKWDGTTQDLVVSLDVLNTTPDAGFIMPIPAQAEVTLEDAALFTELEDRTAARVEKVTNWWPNLSFLDKLGLTGQGDDTAGATAPVDVLEERELGPLTVAQLAANDPAALPAWLTANGYPVDEAVALAATPYAEAGWIMVAVKLTPVEVGAPLEGEIQPIKLRFPSAEPVYPMRLSQLATAPITVELYVLAPNRMDPEFTAVQGDTPALGFAGLIDPANIGPVSQIGQWLTEPTYLTRYDQVINDPSQITGDYTFTPAAEDEEYQAVIFVDRDLGWLTGGLLALLGLTLLAVVPTRIMYKRKIRAERQAGAAGQPV